MTRLSQSREQESFPFAEGFRIARLGVGDAKQHTEQWRDFEKLILSNEVMYPEISRWLRQRVAPRLASSERRAYVAYVGERAVASAVLKRGSASKFCHVKIIDELQEQSVGDLFFALMTLEVAGVAREIHFTLPENVWHTRRQFFESFGFRNVDEAGTQYRLFEKELRSSAPFELVWRRTQEKLPRLVQRFLTPGLRTGASLVMSIRPRFVENLLSGVKSVEVRRRFSTKWVGQRIALYATEPEACLAGEAEIAGVESGPPGWIWERLGSSIGCSREEFDAYVGRSARVYAIHLSDIRPYSPPIRREDVQELFGGDLVPPQSYSVLSDNVEWTRAVSLASMLRGESRTGDDS